MRFFKQHLNIIEIQQALASAIPFTPDDLAANRVHKMTTRQQRRLLLRIGGDFLACLWVLAIFAALLIEMSRTGIQWIYFVVLGILLFALARTILHISQCVQDTYTDEVLSITGQVRFKWFQGKPPRHAICIQDKQFFVRRAVWKLFPPGVHYRIYYTPRSKIMLSAELTDAPVGQSEA
jgi:hypothetical protein